MILGKFFATATSAAMLLGTGSGFPANAVGLSLRETQVQSVEASSGTCGENLTWTIDDEGTLTISGTGTMTDWKWSTSLWFRNSGIKKIIIENGVTSIGNNAFESCTNLESITIPNSVKSIGGSALADCGSLKSITIPDSVVSIGEAAFMLTGIESITIPDSVTSIDNFTFCGCTSLTSITLPDSVTNIGISAFENCSSIESVTIPASVKNIDNGVFLGCSSLRSISINSNNPNYSDLNGILFNKDKTQIICYPAAKTNASYIIPDSATSIGDYAFEGCKSLESVTIPDSVVVISYYAFKNCSGLTSITIPDSVKYLADETFYGCSSLKSVKIPDSVTGIGCNVFFGCTSLESVTIPNSVTSMRNFPFQECTSLVSINVDESNPIYSDINGIVFNKDKTEIVCYPAGKKDLSYVIPDSVTRIGDFAFLGCQNLESISIPDSVTRIGESAFTGSSNIKSITIPYSVTKIDDAAFGICTSLTSITILNPCCKICDNQNTISNDCTSASFLYTGVIRGYEGSTAQAYAEKYQRTFESLGASPIHRELGDINNDGFINAVDASSILAYYASISTDQIGDYDADQKLKADVNHDGYVNSVDASLILKYYAYSSVTDKPASIEDYLNVNKTTTTTTTTTTTNSTTTTAKPTTTTTETQVQSYNYTLENITKSPEAFEYYAVKMNEEITRGSRRGFIDDIDTIKVLGSGECIPRAKAALLLLNMDKTYSTGVLSKVFEGYDDAATKEIVKDGLKYIYNIALLDKEEPIIVDWNNYTDDKSAADYMNKLVETGRMAKDGYLDEYYTVIDSCINYALDSENYALFAFAEGYNYLYGSLEYAFLNRLPENMIVDCMSGYPDEVKCLIR